MSKNNWSPIPEPTLNGGLYTGQPFSNNAPWANVPVRPTSAYMTHMNLRSANPPLGALFQLQAGHRPGNNSDDAMPGVKQFIGNENFGPFDFMCVLCTKQPQAPHQRPPGCEEKVISIP